MNIKELLNDPELHDALRNEATRIVEQLHGYRIENNDYNKKLVAKYLIDLYKNSIEHEHDAEEIRGELAHELQEME